MSQDFSSIASTFGRTAATALDTVADALLGKASTLRNGTEHKNVELPRDLYAHALAQTEWWYYTGHLRTETSKHTGFELVFFKRRTDLDRFGVVPLRLVANPLYLAHFALTEQESKRFRYEHRKTTNGGLDAPAHYSASSYYLKLGNWYAREAHGLHLLRASLKDGTLLELALKPVKPAILNGHASDGVSFKDHGEASRYFSYTRMTAEGTITIGKQVEKVVGTSWMDREFGTWTTTENQKGWDWFSFQFDDETELMVYHIRDEFDCPSSFSSGSFIDREGNRTHLAREDFELTPTGYWKSPATDAVYPSGWRVRVAKFEIDVTVTPVLKNQELDTRGTTMVIYWEGACVAEGTRGANRLTGRAYVELVGYDRSHEKPSIASFLFGSLKHPFTGK